ncbi:MAG: hypothetical protein WBI36_05640, partial [Erysipelotrichaceae bacterium]
ISSRSNESGLTIPSLLINTCHLIEVHIENAFSFISFSVINSFTDFFCDFFSTLSEKNNCQKSFISLLFVCNCIAI